MFRSRLFGAGVVALIALGLAVGQALAADEPENSQARRGRQFSMEHAGGGLMLLRSDVVAKDLNLTDEQKESLKKIGEDAHQKMSEMRESLKDASASERMAKMRGMEKEIGEKVDGVLNAEQKARLKQIKLQVLGAAALSEDEVQDSLKVTEDQEESLKNLAKQRRKAVQAAFKDAGSDRAAAREAIKKIDKETNEKMLAVLTPEQREQFDKMQGKKLDLSGLRFGGPGGLGRRPANSEPKSESKSESK